MDEVQSMKEELFTIAGRTLRYNFDQLTMGQLKIAEAVYEFQGDLEKNPPRSVDEKVRLSGDYDLRVLACILMEEVNGAVVPFDYTDPTKLPLLSVVQQMSAKDAKKAKDCINDFFDRCGRTTLRLLVQSAYEMKYARAKLEGLARTQAAIMGSISDANLQLENTSPKLSDSPEQSNGE